MPDRITTSGKKVLLDGAVLDMRCAEQSGYVAECACPHEHWHVGRAGCCLDVHFEDDGLVRVLLDAGDFDDEVEFSDLADMEAARAAAFAWFVGKYGDGKPV